MNWIFSSRNSSKYATTPVRKKSFVWPSLYRSSSKLMVSKQMDAAVFASGAAIIADEARTKYLKRPYIDINLSLILFPYRSANPITMCLLCEYSSGTLLGRIIFKWCVIIKTLLRVLRYWSLVESYWAHSKLLSTICDGTIKVESFTKFYVVVTLTFVTSYNCSM